jgi:hypothetical protein
MVSLKSNRHREWNLVREVANDLCRRGNGALFRGKRGESLRELRVAVVLASVGGGEELLGRGQFGGKLRAVALVRAPGLHRSDKERDGDYDCGEFEPKTVRHKVFLWRGFGEKPSRRNAARELRSFSLMAG